ncbi:hypothetical protein GCM10010376_30490 [Streptomyces violaceusniger]
MVEGSLFRGGGEARSVVEGSLFRGGGEARSVVEGSLFRGGRGTRSGAQEEPMAGRTGSGRRTSERHALAKRKWELHAPVLTPWREPAPARR